jgi:hypothetical protein
MRGLAFCAVLLAAPATAQGVDFIPTWGKLTDTEFYSLVTCGAPPGGPCAGEVARWSDGGVQALRVALRPAEPGVNPAYADAISAAVDQAIAEINAAGSRVQMIRVGPNASADIRLYITQAGDGQPISGTGDRDLDGIIIGAGLVNVWWEGPQNKIYDAAIVYAGDMPPSSRLPVVLEELTQALGFLWDVRNPAYDQTSVFSEDSNSVARLGPQDRMVLLRHYPPDAAGTPAATSKGP